MPPSADPPVNQRCSTVSGEPPSIDRRTALKLAGTAATASALAGCSVLESSEESEWNTFRGTTARTGVAPTGTGPGESLDVAWQMTVDDIVEQLESVSVIRDGEDEDGDAIVSRANVSDPILAEDNIIFGVNYEFFPTERGGETGNTVQIVALDAASGAFEWTYEIEDGGAVIISSRPRLANGGIYFIDYTDSALVTLDPASGELVDSQSVERSISSPVITSDQIYAWDTEGVTAIPVVGAAASWDLDLPVPPTGKWMFTNRDGQLYYSVPNEAGSTVVSVRADDGDINWQTDVDLPESTGEQSVKWELNPPTVTEDACYAASYLQTTTVTEGSPLVSLDVTDGSERWRFRPDGDGAGFVYGRPVVLDDIAVTPGGEVVDGDPIYRLYGLSTDDGTEQWSIEMGNEFISRSPVATGDVVYTRTTEHVVAVSTDGTRLDTFDFKEIATGRTMRWWTSLSPAIGEGRLYVPGYSRMVAFE